VRLVSHSRQRCVRRALSRLESGFVPRPQDEQRGRGSSPGHPGTGGRTAVDLLNVLVGLILDPNVGGTRTVGFAARVPLTVLAEVGAKENAIRMALTRHVQRGLLSSQRVGREVVYEFTDFGIRTFAGDVSARVRAGNPFESTSAVWTLVTFSVPESRRDVRSRLRIHLGRRGFRALRDGVWVALNSAAAAEVTRELDPEVAENIALDVFIATPHFSTGLTEILRRGWDVDELRRRHLDFLERWEGHEVATNDALPVMLLFAADWVDLLGHDPGLPADVLGAGWPAQRSARTAARLFRALEVPAGSALRKLITDGYDRQQANLSMPSKPAK
jgi:phenylacetic acid degradation operon negative regulatory protein